MDVLDWLVMTLTGWYFRSQPQQPPGVYVLVINMQLTSSIWWGFRINKMHKDMTQNIIYSRWGRTRVTFFWKLNYYYLAWLICFCIFSFLIASNLLFVGLPWRSSGEDSALQLRGAWVLPLVSGIKNPPAVRPKQTNKINLWNSGKA